MDWRAVWRVLSPKRMIEPDVREEISFHIEGGVRELMARGWSELDARTHVLERFGDVESVEEACRTYDTQRVDGETWRLTMEAWMRDVKFALRSMRRNAGFTTVVVLTLALGVGSSTAVFSVVESILLRPLPFPEPDELALVWQNDRASETVRENASTSDYYDYLERNHSFEDLAIYGLGTAVLVRPDAAPLQLNAASVSQNLAPVLGVEMQLGRNFTVVEDVPEGPSVMILTDRVWSDTFVADPRVAGSVFTINPVSSLRGD
jgi:hypothetical protein